MANAPHITHWTVLNLRTGEVRTYKSSAAAMRGADRQDMEYGAICTRRKAHWSDEHAPMTTAA
jgi:hypothetical protein